MQLISWIVGLVTLALMTGCARFDERSRGIEDAKRRLRNGELVSKGPNGRHSDGFGEYAKILREEHGLHIEGSLGESKEYVQGFTSVMEPEIDKRFDQKFFERIWKQAADEHTKSEEQ